MNVSTILNTTAHNATLSTALCMKDSTAEWATCSGCRQLHSSEAAWWRGGLILLVSLLALPSNLLVIAVFYHTPSLRSNQCIYMLSLAVSDFGSGLCFLLFSFRYSVSGWGPAARFDLDFGAWVYYLMLTATLFITVAIGIDKLHQIKWPYSYERIMTRKRVSLIVCSIWSVIAILSSLPTRIIPINGYYYEFTASTLMFNTKACRANNRVDPSLFITRIALILFMALMLFGGYGTILFVARRHIRAMRQVPAAVGGTADEQKQRRQQQRASSWRGWITNACVILGFLCCWLPFFIYKIAIARRSSSSTEAVQFCLAWFAMLHTSINAAIYGGTYKPFKQGLRRFIRHLSGKSGAGRGELMLSRSPASQV